MIIILIIIVFIVVCVGVYALLVGAQMKKIPELTAREAINYSLKGASNGIITVGVYQEGNTSYAVYGSDGQQLYGT